MAFAHVAEGRAGNNKEPQGSEATISDCHRGTGKVKRTPVAVLRMGAERSP